MHCPKCGSVNKIKAGFIGEKQRYKCKDCPCKYTRSEPKGFPLRVRLTAILLYTHGLSLNAIAKLVGASTPAVLKWVRQFAKDHCEMPTPGESTIVELDEMWHYIKKNTTKSGSGKHWITILDNLSTGSADPVIAIR
jgi:transposase-like protein